MPYVLLALALIGVWLFGLFDVITTDESEVRRLPKFGWFLVVLLGLLPGALLWLALGRAREAEPVGLAARPTLGPTEAPKGPDDDPDFLKDLDRRLRDDE